MAWLEKTAADRGPIRPGVWDLPDTQAPGQVNLGTYPLSGSGIGEMDQTRITWWNWLQTRITGPGTTGGIGGGLTR